MQAANGVVKASPWSVRSFALYTSFVPEKFERVGVRDMKPVNCVEDCLGS